MKITESLKEIQRDLRILLQQQGRGSSSANPLPESLKTKLQNLSLGTSEKQKEGRGKLRVFKDPYKILQEEQEKLRDGHQK